ncbi:amidinotransferase [Ilyomonas limi]|uniref:Amidinotransferase n=1 Tax=Ilyomonas limi TaxID=2575867 RepID=A0A4U3L431_9BACT|nr:arginine deiminase-related protein [Ilyomonas limi]TKK69868.1 amidinotransferase [Ilyomonas limi]
MKQTATTLLMIRPASFGFNAETAASNVFQGSVPMSEHQVQVKAVEEFDRFTNTLKVHGIDVLVIEDTPYPVKPDAVFPNNWFCTLQDGTVATFPMHTANRRIEVRNDLIQTLKDNYIVTNTEDWTTYDADNLFLEGTGSMIIDHENKIIYACLSPRTNKTLLEQFAQAHGYTAVSFHAMDEKGIEVYHTNVMMHIGVDYTVICLDTIKDETERKQVVDSLNKTGHKIINISMEQVHHYAGNMLQVKSNDGVLYTILSQQAYNSLDGQQKQQLQEHTNLLPVNIDTIETVGGGSVRCMMAEIFLHKKRVATA